MDSLSTPDPGPSFPSSASPPDERWRSSYAFSLYRLMLGCFFVLLASTFGDVVSLGSRNLPLFLITSILYVALALISLLALKLPRLPLGLQLAFQVGTDIVCLTVLAHASGGIQSSIEMLLLVSLAAAGLISRGRITLFFAALASIAVLLQHSYVVLTQEAAVAQYLQAGLLCMAYFAVAWLAHTLAKYAIASEKLAVLRGVDLANMAEVNRLVIQDMPDGVLVVDESGMIRQSNSSAERLLGHTGPAGGRAMLSDHAPLLAERLATWRLNYQHSSEIVRLPLTHYQVRVRFQSVQRDGLWGAVVFLEDMQRVQAQAQQIKLVALGRLTANIAHEVRNPLSSISYAAELLREGEHDPAQERLFQIILDNTARLNRIVQDVMQLNQRDRVSSEVISLADKLPVFIDGLGHKESTTQSIIALTVDPGCEVNFDRGHLDQVLWNLCRNALRYCQKRIGSVQLSVKRSAEGRVILEVMNDGPEVTAEVVPKLFEPFFTTSVGGTGLGLYIARELCEANGAALEYVPPDAGGTSFRIIFGGRNER
jgi:two-component system sensor histidine kinase PilS (NtrC family)